MKTKTLHEEKKLERLEEADLAVREKEQGYRFIDEGNQHLHTLNGKSLIGTTTATKEVLKPPLAWYGAGKAVDCIKTK